MVISGQLHAPAALPRGNNQRIHWVGGWKLDEIGTRWQREKSLPLPRIELG